MKTSQPLTGKRATGQERHACESGHPDVRRHDPLVRVVNLAAYTVGPGSLWILISMEVIQSPINAQPRPVVDSNQTGPRSRAQRLRRGKPRVLGEQIGKGTRG